MEPESWIILEKEKIRNEDFIDPSICPVWIRGRQHITESPVLDIKKNRSWSPAVSEPVGYDQARAGPVSTIFGGESPNYNNIRASATGEEVDLFLLHPLYAAVAEEAMTGDPGVQRDSKGS